MKNREQIERQLHRLLVLQNGFSERRGQLYYEALGGIDMLSWVLDANYEDIREVKNKVYI